MIRLGARAVCVGRRGARVLLQGAAGGCSCVRTPQAAARVMKRRSHCSDDDWGVPRCMHSARMKGPLRCVELGGRACCGSPEHRAPRTSVHGQTTSVEQGASGGGSTSEQRQGTRRFAICTPASLPMQSCVSGRRMPVLACKNRVHDASINRARRPACQRANAEQASEQLQAPARHLPARQKLVFFLSFFCFATGQLGVARKINPSRRQPGNVGIAAGVHICGMQICMPFCSTVVNLTLTEPNLLSRRTAQVLCQPSRLLIGRADTMDPFVLCGDVVGPLSKSASWNSASAFKSKGRATKIAVALKPTGTSAPNFEPFVKTNSATNFD